MRRAGHRVTVLAGADAAGSARLARRAVDDGVDALVVCGGDGLLFHALPAVRGTGVAVGLVPTGTGNDTVTALGLPSHPSAALDAVTDALAAGATTAVDLGVAAHDDGRQTPFATVLCVGFDAAVSDLGARLPSPPAASGISRYDLAIAWHAARLRHHRVTVGLDDDPPRDREVLLAAVGNGGWYGGGKRMVPHAAVDDGRLGVTLVGRVTRRTLARLAPTLPRAGHVGHPAVTTTSAARVTLHGTGTAWADGEPVGPLPVTITTDPGALTVLRPPWCTVPPGVAS